MFYSFSVKDKENCNSVDSEDYDYRMEKASRQIWQLIILDI